MRQYGAINGNAWESEREFLVERARAIEGRVGQEEIEAGVDEHTYGSPCVICVCSCLNCELWDEWIDFDTEYSYSQMDRSCT